MKIETEFDLGDEVFFVEKEKIKKAPVQRIYISIDKQGVSMEYRYLKTISAGSIFTTIKNPKKTIEELAET